MFVVDTNILVAAAVETTVEHPRARSALEGWQVGEEPFYSTWPIFYEFLQVFTHRGLWPRPGAFADGLDFLGHLLAAPQFDLLLETDRHGTVLQELARAYPGLSGNILHDFHTAVLMREHGITEIRSADMDFHRFRFLRVVNPL